MLERFGSGGLGLLKKHNIRGEAALKQAEIAKVLLENSFTYAEIGRLARKTREAVFCLVRKVEEPDNPLERWPNSVAGYNQHNFAPSYNSAIAGEQVAADEEEEEISREEDGKEQALERVVKEHIEEKVKASEEKIVPISIATGVSSLNLEPAKPEVTAPEVTAKRIKYAPALAVTVFLMMLAGLAYWNISLIKNNVNKITDITGKQGVLSINNQEPESKGNRNGNFKGVPGGEGQIAENKSENDNFRINNINGSSNKNGNESSGTNLTIQNSQNISLEEGSGINVQNTGDGSYKISTKPKCQNGETLKWKNGGWQCAKYGGGNSGTTTSGTAYTAGDGIGISADQISVIPAAAGGLQNGAAGVSIKVDGSSLSTSANGIKVSDSYSGQDSISTVGTITSGTWQGSVISAAYLPASTSYLGSSIETGEITDGTILAADLSSSNVPGGGEALTYNAGTGGFTWQAVGGMGTVTQVNSGNGLTGGPIVASGTLSINSPTCSGTDKLQWNGTAFVCSPDVDTNTTYTAGDGLDLTGTVFSTDLLAAGGLQISGVNNELGIKLDGSTLSLGAGGLKLSDTYAGQSTIVTVGTITTGTWNGTAIDDAHVANDITASNYLPLVGGTLTGTLTLNDNDGASNDVNLTIGDTNETGQIIFYDGSANTGTLALDALGADAVYTFSGATGTVLTNNNYTSYLTHDSITGAGTVDTAGEVQGVAVGGDVSGTVGNIAVTDDSHSHTAATLPASTSYLGSSIETGEITDDTILEADLHASNSASGGQMLTYNVGTGGFTWADAGVGGSYLPLAGGTMTGGIVFSGVVTDLTSGTNEDIVISPNGTGKVGILTASPNEALEVTGNVRSSGVYKIDTAQVLSLGNGKLPGNIIVGNGGENITNSSGIDGYYNTAVGIDSMTANTTGALNVALGNSALCSNTTGSSNTAIGSDALCANNIGYENVALGANTLALNTTGHDNTALGTEALGRNTSGNNNVALGYQAGAMNETGEGNVFLGYQAGLNETGSNKLYIDNSNTTSPLIYGDFSTNSLTVNGTLNPTGDLTVGASSAKDQIVISPVAKGTDSYTGTITSADITGSAKTWTFPNVSGNVVTTGDTGTVTGTMILDDTVALTTDTTGNYVANVANGNGLSGGSAGSEGASLTLALGNLTADWNQNGAYDLVLQNASSELKIKESAGDTYYGIFDVGDLSADATYTFSGASGTVYTSANDPYDTAGEIQAVSLGGALGGTIGSATIGNDTVALTTNTTGNYVANVANGNGITGGSAGSEGASLTLALGAFTADWIQSGAYDIKLANASSELRIMESAGDTYYGTLDVGDLSADATYTFAGPSGNVLTSTSEPVLTNGGRHTRAVEFKPEYAGAVLTKFYGGGTETSYTGTMTSDTEGASPFHNYYNWTSSEAALNGYSVSFSVALPSDFDSWTTSNALQLSFKTSDASSSNNEFDAYVYDNSGSLVASSTGNASTSWTTVNFSAANLSGWATAGNSGFVYIRMRAQNSNTVRAGEIKMNYMSKW